MSDMRDAIVSAMFRPVPGGYVFRSPNQSVFGDILYNWYYLMGDAPHYLVNEAQKAEIVAIITPRRPILRVIVITIALLLWVVAAMWIVLAFGYGQANLALSDVIVFTGLILVPVVLALQIALWRKLRRLQPVLVGLPRTDERITNRDFRQARANAMSFERLLLLGAGATLVGAGWIKVSLNTFSHVDWHLFMPLLSIVIFLGLGANFFSLAILKAKQKQGATRP